MPQLILTLIFANSSRKGLYGNILRLITLVPFLHLTKRSEIVATNSSEKHKADR